MVVNITAGQCQQTLQSWFVVAGGVIMCMELYSVPRLQ